MEKYEKSHIITTNLKYQPQRGTENLSYLVDHILFQIIKIISSISSKKREKVTDNPPIKIYVNKIENRITFKIKRGYYLELLTLVTMKLVR